MSAILAGEFVEHSPKKSVSLINFTNHILVNDLTTQTNEIVYYIPVYLRAKLKNIIEMDFEKLAAKVNLDFIMSVYVAGLSD